jgi:hypothetical protein
VPVVNQVFARQLFGAENPIGQQDTDEGATHQIIAVANNIKSRSLGEDLRPVLFRSLEQTVSSYPSFMEYTLLIRYEGNPALVAGGRAKRFIRSTRRWQFSVLKPWKTACATHSFWHDGRGHAVRSIWQCRPGPGRRRFLWCHELFGQLRTREIGIHMAPGAQVGAMQRLIVHQE